MRPVLRLGFLDFEASSLYHDSWPIEIGLARVALSEIKDGPHLKEGAAAAIAATPVEVTSALICPDASWSLEAWSEVSAGVHGIPLEHLYAARPASEVAMRFHAVLSGCLLISDNASWEKRWLYRLMDTATGTGAGRFKVYPIANVLQQLCGRDMMPEMKAELGRSMTRHRAGADAEKMARAFLAVMAQSLQGTPPGPAEEVQHDLP